MEGIKKCFECGLGFPRIGIITSEERLREHEKTPHEVQCRECGTFFVSDAHVKYHLSLILMIKSASNVIHIVNEVAQRHLHEEWS